MEILRFSQADIGRRLVRWKDLKPIENHAGRTGDVSESTRKAAISQSVYGLTSPSGGGERNFWDSGAVPAGAPNFGAVYVTAAPGEGASWHVHRFSWENFIAIKGRWRIFWNDPEAEEHVDLEPFDMVSIPPGAIRRFEYVGEDEGLMLAFAYAAAHPLTLPFETFLPWCEIERLERLAEGKGEEQAAYAATMRAVAEHAYASETEADRDFTRSTAAYIASETART
jgi:mannose-6-phosphate isomerase-like protein (cupin superfamily)